MKSRKQASLKVDKEIHDKIKWFRERGLIKESIQEFVNKTISDKLDIVGHNEISRIMREKTDELTVEMGKMSMRLNGLETLKKKTHTRSRTTKRKK